MVKGLIYLICPVRKAAEHEKKVLDRYVRRLEHQGYEVHYPPRDVNQNDPVGTTICTHHRSAIWDCSEVRAVWNPESKGSLFDFGMAWIEQKPFRLANKRRIENWLKEPQHSGKSYERVAYELDEVYRGQK